MQYRRAHFHAKTVELQPHELPPPPNASERFIDALHRAAAWAPDLGEDVAVMISDLITEAKQRITGRAA